MIKNVSNVADGVEIIHNAIHCYGLWTLEALQHDWLFILCGVVFH